MIATVRIHEHETIHGTLMLTSPDTTEWAEIAHSPEGYRVYTGTSTTADMVYAYANYDVAYFRATVLLQANARHAPHFAA